MLAPRASVACPCSERAEPSDIKFAGPPTSTAYAHSLRPTRPKFYARDPARVNVLFDLRFAWRFARLPVDPSCGARVRGCDRVEQLLARLRYIDPFGVSDRHALQNLGELVARMLVEADHLAQVAV